MDWNVLIALTGLLVAFGLGLGGLLLTRHSVLVAEQALKFAEDERVAGHREALYEAQLTAVGQSLSALFELVVQISDALDAGNSALAKPAYRAFLQATAASGAVLPRPVVDAFAPVVGMAGDIVHGLYQEALGVDPAQELTKMAGIAVQNCREAVGTDALTEVGQALVERAARGR